MNEEGTEIDRLRAELTQLAEHNFKHQAQNGALREENAGLKSEIDWHIGEIKRLRAEIVQFKHALEMQQHTEMGLRAENEKMTNRLRNPELTLAENTRLHAEIDRLKKSDREWREMFGARDLNLDDELQAKIDRLRAENAELNKALQKMITEGIARAEAKLILAKTASHQPASDQEPQKSA